MTSISAERLSQLIGLIYDCAIDPKAWLPNLETLRSELGFHNAALEVYALSPMSRVLGVVAGVAPEFVESMPLYEADIMDIWGGAERVAQYPLEEPVVGSQVAGQKALEATRYFREWCEPQGVIDAVAIPILRDTNTLASLGMGRHLSTGKITEGDLASLRLIAPHLRRAVSINQLLKLQSLQVSTFSSTLDSLEAAILFVDEALRIAYANAAASERLVAGDLVGQQQGVLRLSDQVAFKELASAVSLAIRSETHLGRRGIGIPVRRNEGEHAIIHVLPLSRGAMRSALVGGAVAALFVTPGLSAPPVPTDALARLYDLTPAEARTMELVANGRTSVEVGEQLGVAQNTVKTHLKQIFAKTGCQRQADLASFVNAYRLPA